MSDEVKQVILNKSVITDTEAQMAGDVETPWLELPERAAAPAKATDKDSALLYALVSDHMPRVKLSTGAVLNLGAGLASDVLDAVIAVANATGGVTTAACTVDLKDLAGAAHAAVGVVRIVAANAQYAGDKNANANVTFGTATKGSILASGSGWAVVKTDANGQFACTATNAVDETVYFSVTGVNGGVDALAAGVLVRGCLPDAATWSA
jgi:hypothetical protein